MQSKHLFRAIFCSVIGLFSILSRADGGSQYAPEFVEAMSCRGIGDNYNYSIKSDNYELLSSLDGLPSNFKGTYITMYPLSFALNGKVIATMKRDYDHRYNTSAYPVLNDHMFYYIAKDNEKYYTVTTSKPDDNNYTPEGINLRLVAESETFNVNEVTRFENNKKVGYSVYASFVAKATVWNNSTSPVSKISFKGNVICSHIVHKRY